MKRLADVNVNKSVLFKYDNVYLQPPEKNPNTIATAVTAPMS